VQLAMQKWKAHPLRILVGIVFFVAALLFLGLLLWWRYSDSEQLDISIPPDSSIPQWYAMSEMGDFIVKNWKSWDSKTLQEREKLILEEAQRHEPYITLYTVEIDNAYMILISPKTANGKVHFPRVFLSKGSLEAIEPLRPERLN
jgi:hypothetical protein